jgi:uncharacterized protein (TIGR02996 family)
VTEAEWIAFLQRPEIPAFNRAMLENPDDDLPRLVFADWMDENCSDDAVNAAVRESITNDRRWTEWPHRQKNRKWRLSFTRGRLAAWVDVQIRPPDRRPPRIVLEACWPTLWVEAISFGTLQGYHLEGWLRDRPAETLLTLGISGRGRERPLALVCSSRLYRLTHLIVDGWDRPASLFPSLTECLRIGRLSHLTLIGITFEPGEVEQLAGSPTATRLQSLSLVHCQVSAAGAAALANSPYLCEAIRGQFRHPPDDGGANR